MWSAILILLSVAAGMCVLANVGQPLRVIIAFSFLFVAPGAAVIGLFRIQDAVARIVLSLALSVTLEMILAEIMVYARIWSMQRAILILVTVAVLAAIAPHVLHFPRSSASRSGTP